MTSSVGSDLYLPIEFCKIGRKINMQLHVVTVKILKFGTPQTIAIIVLKLVKFDVTLH